MRMLSAQSKIIKLQYAITLRALIIEYRNTVTHRTTLRRNVIFYCEKS